MKAAVQLDYYSGNPQDDIAAVKITLILDPDLSVNETPEILAFLRYLKTHEILAIQKGGGEYLTIEGKDLAVDWPVR
ncbi:MAG TPA: hypothetical protein VJC15_02620 [Candidatus Paceibacterota bacterium]